MEYLLRIKAVSSCIGIRRANLTYKLLKNGNINLKDLDHPLSLFEKIIINNGIASCLQKSELLKLGEEIYFYNNKNVESYGRVLVEANTLEIALLPLDLSLEVYYKECIMNNSLLDQWNGEYEYIIGLIEEYENKNIVEANEWYDKARRKKFNFKIINS